jgi:hypothetical protein
MARVHPFRAWRFGPFPVRLQEVITQPCGRICAPIEKAFDRPGSSSPVPILLELPDLFDAVPGESVYYREARDFQACLGPGILVEEQDRGIFACRERYTPPGTAFVPGTGAGGWQVRSKPEAGAAPGAAFSGWQGQPGGCRLRSIARRRLSALGAKRVARRACLPTAGAADRAADPFRGSEVRGSEAEIGLAAHPVLLQQRRRATCAVDRPRPRSCDFFPKPLSSLAIYALD